MPLPHSPTKKSREVQPINWSGFCCIQADDHLQATLVPSEPASARRPMSEVHFTPRTPTGPPPILIDQVLELERRLQSSVALIMEQQYERLSGEVLDILRRSQQNMPFRTSGRMNASALGTARTDTSGASVKSLHQIRKDLTPTASTVDSTFREAFASSTDGVPPLLNLGKVTGDAAQATIEDSPKPPLLASPRAEPHPPGDNMACLQLNGHGGNDGSVTASDGAEVGIAADGNGDSAGEADYGQALTVVTKDRGNTSHRSSDSTTKGRARMSSTKRSDDIILLDAMQDLKHREKKVQDKMKNKYRKQNSAEKDSLADELIQESVGVRILHNPLFDSLCALAIIFNSILIGFSVEWLTTHEEETALLIFLGHLCNLFFFLELTFRLCVLRLSYFTNEDWSWNCFDFMLVVFAVIDFLLWLTIGTSGAGTVGSTLKIVKMLRIVRIFRVFRFFRELSLLALLIIDSLRSLVWAIVMLTIIIYVFAIGFTQNATEFSRTLGEKNMSSNNKHSEILELFGSLPRTIYSLLYSMLGGVSWGIVSDALMRMDAFSALLFFFYISFSVLAVLNIITGVFVDNAVETAKIEREFLIQRETELREKLLAEMQQLFSEMDEDKSGSVSLTELQSYFDDELVQRYFHAFGLDPTDAERLFRLIDADGSGEVQVAEFLDGCLRLKGEARSIDVNAILWQCRQTHSTLEKLSGRVNEYLLLDQGFRVYDKPVENEKPKLDGKGGDRQVASGPIAAFCTSETRPV